MRNLVLSALENIPLPDVETHITATAIDLDEAALYIASETVANDEVQVKIFKTQMSDRKDFGIKSDAEQFAQFSTIAAPNGPYASQVVSMRVNPETRKIVLVLRAGDITTVSLEEDTLKDIEVEGTVEPGIPAASWSPDDTILAIVTGESKLILMTSTFEVLSEGPLHTNEFGEDAPVNVGWGSKQTQFHGSLGKAAAQAPSQQLIGTSPDDDTTPRISWRGDAAHFVISSLITPKSSSVPRRVLRVYDRQGALQSTSEAVAGLEHVISWRPSGNLIAGTQRFGFEGGGQGKVGRHDVVFFERNGLRHGEFGLRVLDMGISSKVALQWGYRVRELSWNSDSTILCIWIQRDGLSDLVQLWTTGNYHWYLKHEFGAPDGGNFTSVEWHPEQALRLVLTTNSHILQRYLNLEVFSSPSLPPNDSGTVAVSDGAELRLTPFRVQNVPPPMASHTLSLANLDTAFPQDGASRIPIHSSFSAHSETLAVLWECGYFELWALGTRLALGRGKIMDPKRVLAYQVSKEQAGSYRQVVLLEVEGRQRVVLLATTRAGDVAVEIVAGGGEVKLSSILLPEPNGQLLARKTSFIWVSAVGELFEFDSEEKTPSPIASFPQLCSTTLAVQEPSTGANLYIGLAESGKLYVTGDHLSTYALASNATSFTATSAFLIYTSSVHESAYVPLSSIPPFLESSKDGTDVSPPVWEKRRVERGSRIVVAVESTMSLVLQMPRGNLETINPRPLVMAVVTQDLHNGLYRKAFLACRKHRIDLNAIVQHDQEAFVGNVKAFVEQVHEVDYINLLLTNVGRGPLPASEISKICDAIREELESRDLTKYVNSILTAHVVKSPPDHEAALSLLLRLKDAHRDIVEDAVKYVIFLVDANKLFDTALGMYDFALVLMIAQHAQKDPREYLPFLRELRALETYHQRFRIDDYLKRYPKALKNLSLAGPTFFDQAVEYVERYQLYTEALSIWAGTEHYTTILTAFGDWLYERREFRQAAAAYVEAGANEKAIMAYEKELDWRALFELAIRQDMEHEDLVATGYRVYEDLVAKKRFSEAAQVLLDYCEDLREAVVTLVQGNHFSEARRLVSLKRAPELSEEVIYPGALSTREQIGEDLNEMKEQLRKQLSRLRELRVKKIEEPDAFYGVEDTALHDVDVMTDASMAPTAFTRYTVAPTTASRRSKQSSRSKRKQERKVGSGRKGTVDEEEYLLTSVGKLVGRFNTAQDEARGLLPHLFQFTPEHRAEGLALQKEIDEFEAELREAVEWIWAKTAEEQETEAPPPDSWAARMEEVERRKRLNPIDKVVRPDIPQTDWRMKLLDI